jgi:thiamine-monophosphate kinase
MMDISDGLSLDLWRMCRASGVGATLNESEMGRVISPDAVGAAERDGRSPLEHALSDGEDFELLLAVEGGIVDSQAPVHPVGFVTESGFQWRRDDGSAIALEPKGYVH